MFTLRGTLIPEWPLCEALIFHTHEKALQHLCDHVLTRPEAHYWALLIPNYTEVVDSGDGEALFRLARSFWSQHPPHDPLQTLYDGYASVIARAVRDAVRFGWYWDEQTSLGPSRHGLGTSGVYAIWSAKSVNTALLLSYASPPQSGDDCPIHRRTNPLPRQNTWAYRGARLRNEDAHFPPVNENPLQSRYRLFKKCATRFKREFRTACSQRDVSSSGPSLESLCNHVPSEEVWQQLRNGEELLTAATRVGS